MKNIFVLSFFSIVLFGCSTFPEAVMGGDTSAVKNYLKKGEDANSRDENNTSMLMLASRENHIDVVKILMENGADVNAINSNGWTAVMFAAYNNNNSIIEYLVRSGANVDIQNKDGMTTLMIASGESNQLTVKEILKYTKKVNDKNKYGNNALACAVLGDKRDNALLLMENNIEINNVNNFGETALYIAYITVNDEIYNAIKEKGGETNIQLAPRQSWTLVNEGKSVVLIKGMSMQVVNKLTGLPNYVRKSFKYDNEI